MTHEELVEKAKAELYPEGKGGGQVWTSGVAFEHISKIAEERGLETQGIVAAFVDENDNVSTPIVVDKKTGDNLIVLTQDSDHIVMSKEQAQSLKTILSNAVGE